MADTISDRKSIAFIVAAVLVGYYPVFQGASFFAEEDPVVLADYLKGNASLAGWRPDKALGMSFFFGDPGMFHSWAPLAFLERLLPTGHVAYNASIIALAVCAAVAQFYFLKRVAPGLGVAGALLAPVVVFSSVQHELYFQRHWIALALGTPLLMMLLQDYFERPRWTHVVSAMLLFWFVMFLGSSRSFLCLLVVGLVFGAAYWAYHRPPAFALALKQGGLYAAAIAGMLLLGAWVFYAMALEWRAIVYERAPAYTHWEAVTLSYLAYVLLSPFHSGLIDPHVPSVTLNSFLWLTMSWTNVSPVFPFVFVLAFARRPQGFWPWALRWMLVAFLANELLFAVPGYAYVLHVIWPVFPLDKFQPAYQSIQVAVIGCVLADVASGTGPVVTGKGATVIRRLAAVLAVPYCVLGLYALVAVAAPRATSWLALRVFDLIGPSHAAGFSKAVLREAVQSDVLQLARSMHWPSIGFYGLTAAIIVALWRNPALTLPPRRSRTTVAAVLLAEAFLLSWAVYPMYKRPLVWEVAAAPPLKPTDRVYLFFDPTYQAIEKTVAGFRTEWVDGEFGPPVNRVGYRTPPSLNVSSIVSFWPHAPADYMREAFRQGGSKLSDLRELYFGPFVRSGLLDMAAISHYASFRPLPASTGMPLEFKQQQLYVYRNPSAWPYFYLADAVQESENPIDLDVRTKGTAYVSADTLKDLPPVSGQGDVRLRDFSYGRLVFDVDAASPELLVVADAWHPFWRARADEEELRVVKANGIFKGVPLPRGRHTVTLFFDTMPYMPGVYVSAVSWIALAITCAVLAWRGRQRPVSMAAAV